MLTHGHVTWRDYVVVGTLKMTVPDASTVVVIEQEHGVCGSGSGPEYRAGFALDPATIGDSNCAVD